ncbi:MAG: hypothetical protein K2Q18_19475, partial [Bdellovibrionales bacterium]|nr:hypothetical protein [Bdellovibrionales bacterium]
MKGFGSLITLLCFTLLVASEMLHAQEKAPERINIAISAIPNNLAPFYSTDANSQNINRLVHSALIDFNEKMQFVCIACETYQEKMVGKKHILTFRLKSGLTFSDGSPVTAEDVKKS